MAGQGPESSGCTAPPEEWKPFMRRKMAKWVSAWTLNKGGKMTWTDYVEEVAKFTEQMPEAKREQVAKERLQMWQYIVMCDKNVDVITEEEVIDVWMQRMYDVDKRESALNITKILSRLLDPRKLGTSPLPQYAKVVFSHRLSSLSALGREMYFWQVYDFQNDALVDHSQKMADAFFEQMDHRQNGKVNFPEYRQNSVTLNDEAALALFNHIDINKDGFISKEEWTFAICEFILSSGPNNPISNLFGMIDNE